MIENFTSAQIRNESEDKDSQRQRQKDERRKQSTLLQMRPWSDASTVAGTVKGGVGADSVGGKGRRRVGFTAQAQKEYCWLAR
ncbi:hypothetical protein JTE90_021464 [Oedothorax gibbosus]|uniref:Uncharacterized protein n=1 Tax=Oedothorax gibbosus TaxID=931172 RepID=A0AAV6VYT5_9ARAC|nr:hypothetical protein JTE90_021464 [Oedothorax gibbosus]